MSHRYKDLIVWQRARVLAEEVYRASEMFPKKEVYGLTSQIRRAAVSVVSNIAEGQGRLTREEFLQFLGHSRGSLFELETQLTIAADLNYFRPEKVASLEEKTSEVKRLLNGLIDSLLTKDVSVCG